MLTLRVRLILVLLVVLFASGLFTWFGVRPSYESAVVDGRIALITEVQQQRIGLAESRIGQWLRGANELKGLLVRDPLRLESVAQAYIRLLPDLKSVRVTEVSSGEFIQINASGVTDFPPFSELRPQLFEFRTEEAMSGVWDDRDRFFIVSDLSIGRQPYRLALMFDASAMRAELTTNLLGEGSGSSIVSGDSLVATVVERLDEDGATWLVVRSPIGVAPVTHVVRSDMRLVTAPVRELFTQTLLLLLVVFLVLATTAWLLTDLLRRPLDRFLQDVTPFADLEFDTPFRGTTLPELSRLTGQMEQIRMRLKHYKRINVEQIIVQEQRNRMLMTHAAVLVGHVDEHGAWLFRNEALSALLAQVSPEEDIGSLTALMDLEQVTVSDDTTTTVVREDVRIENRHFDLEVGTESGAAFVLRGHRMETFASDGSHLGGFVLFSDITQDREIDRMRTEMIHIIVHELQNPVAAVRGFLEILREEEMTQEELNEIYALCARSVETLRVLIERFLEITRLESGKMQIDMEPVLMSAMLKDVIDTFRPQLKEKHLEIELRTAAMPVVLGSQALLEDVVRNLVSNAIKYGHPNRRIEVDLGTDGQDVVFSVTDHGFGIPEEHRDKMFQKFYRIKAYNRQKGNGLGLAYVKEVVNRHHGTITYESNPEIGTRFIVRLPQEMGE